jgi:hypothetical protein
MEVHLDKKSARELASFTVKRLGHSVEARFQNIVLAKAVLRTPVDGGHFQVSVPPDHVDGTLNESNATEIAQKLSLSGAKVEFRVVD